MMMWTVPAVKWVENQLYIRYIRGLLREEKFDTAVIYSDVTGEIAVKAVRAEKYLMYYHHGAMRRVYHDHIPWKKCEKIVAVSNNQAELLRDYFSKYADKIVVIHNLTDVKGIRKKGAMETAEVFEADKFHIVSVGRVSHEKGMDLAVRVCAKLVADGYENIRWWIVGDGPDMQEVRETIAETQMEDYIVTVGMKPNPYPYIRKADFYVQPSRFEGYPMTVLETLILGQPVVSTDNNGAREILENEETGVLVPVDVDKIADVIEKLMQNDNGFQTMKETVWNMDFEIMNQKCRTKLEAFI